MADSIDTFFIDLAVRGDALQTDVGKFVADIEKQLGQELGKSTEGAERKFKSLGSAITSTFQSVISVLALTKNPLAAVVSGLMAFNGAVQAAAQGGAAWAQSLAPMLGPLAGLITILSAVAGAFQKVINFMQQTGEQGVKLAARVQTLNTGLEVIARNAGVNVDMVREKVAVLQGTGITTQESIESLMKFLSQSLPVDNIEKLARAGQDMAVAFGQDSTATFQRFVYAITTGNAEVLQMVGIQKTAASMMEDYAKSINKTTAQLTEQERRQAIVNGIMKESLSYAGLYEKSLESLGKRIGSLPRYIEEGTLAFGQTLLPLLDASVTATEKFWKAFQKIFVETEKKDIGGGVMKDVPIQLADGTMKLTAFGEEISNAAEMIKQQLVPQVEALIKYLPVVAENALNIVKAVEAIGKIGGPALALIGAYLVTLLNYWAQITTTVLNFFSILKNEPPNAAQSFTKLKETISGWVSATVFAISIVTEVLKNIARLNNGEVPHSWEVMKKAAVDAGKAAYDAMMMVEEKIKKVDAALEAMNALRSEYETVTHQPSQVVENPNALDPSERGMVNTPGFTGWLKSQEKPPVEKDDSAVKSRAENIQKLGTEMADAIEEGNKRLVDAMNAFYDVSGKGGTLKRFDDSVTKAIDKMAESLTKNLDKLKEQYAKARERLATEFSKQLAEVDKQGNKAREDENTRYQETTLRETEDFQLQMKRMDEDYRRTMADFVQSRDAKGALRAMRDFAVNKKNAEEDFSQGRKREDEDHRKRLEEIERRQKEIRQQMQEAYDERLKDLADNQQEQEDAMREAYREQLAELVKNTDEQRQALIDAHTQQVQDIKDSNEKRAAAMVEHWADLGLIDKEGAADILDGLDEYYGEKGKIENLITKFIDRNKRNEAIKITLEQGGDDTDANPPPVTPPVCPAGYRWSEARRMCVRNGDPEPMASGGLVTASRPTSILMGEAGRETALFMPDNAKMGLSQAMSMMAGGGFNGGSGSSSRLDIALSISAEGTLTPQFEDAILDRLADVVLEALPGARLEKNR